MKAAIFCARGSSPLARGLPSNGIFSAVKNRIIPARAGFTYDIWGVEWRGGDHPRSRGVYIIASTVDLELPGSSPLARGLLFDDHSFAFLRGIIPARAGFTVLRFHVKHCRGDHPRSRGVYAC